MNLNADYPGRKDGTIGQQIAAWFVREIFPQVDFIADLHGGGLVREEWVQQVQECMELSMEHLGMYPTSAKKNCCQMIFRETEYSESDRAGVWYPAVREGQNVTKGQLLGELGDFFRTITKQYFASADGTVLYYTAVMCVLEGDPLVAYGLVECFFVAQIAVSQGRFDRVVFFKKVIDISGKRMFLYEV